MSQTRDSISMFSLPASSPVKELEENLVVYTYIDKDNKAHTVIKRKSDIESKEKENERDNE